MKVALLQFAPDVGTVKANIARADDLLRNTKIPVDLDWLILPEMAFSGEFTSLFMSFSVQLGILRFGNSIMPWSCALTYSSTWKQPCPAVYNTEARYLTVSYLRKLTLNRLQLPFS